MDSFAEILKSAATPTGMLAVIIFFLSRSGKFLAPLVEKLFGAHCGMVDALKLALEKTGPLIQEQHDKINDIHDEVVVNKRPTSTGTR